MALCLLRTMQLQLHNEVAASRAKRGRRLNPSSDHLPGQENTCPGRQCNAANVDSRFIASLDNRHALFKYHSVKF